MYLVSASVRMIVSTYWGASSWTFIVVDCNQNPTPCDFGDPTPTNTDRSQNLQSHTCTIRHWKIHLRVCVCVGREREREIKMAMYVLYGARETVYLPACIYTYMSTLHLYVYCLAGV